MSSIRKVSKQSGHLKAFKYVIRGGSLTYASKRTRALHDKIWEEFETFDSPKLMRKADEVCRFFCYEFNGGSRWTSHALRWAKRVKAQHYDINDIDGMLIFRPGAAEKLAEILAAIKKERQKVEGGGDR